MNIKYKIDRDHIFVTDETGTIHKTLKYEQAEETFILQNDIEAIDYLIVSKQSKIDENLKEHKDYRIYTIATIGSIVLTVGSFLLVMSGGLPIIGLGASILFFAAGILAAKKIDDIKKSMTRNDKLVKEIQYLEEMKKNKTIQLEKSKRNISEKQPEKVETMVPIIKRNNEATMEECIQMLRNIEGESTIADLATIYGVMQEIQDGQEQVVKQKVLKK